MGKEIQVRCLVTRQEHQLSSELPATQGIRPTLLNTMNELEAQLLMAITTNPEVPTVAIIATLNQAVRIIVMVHQGMTLCLQIRVHNTFLGLTGSITMATDSYTI